MGRTAGKAPAAGNEAVEEGRALQCIFRRQETVVRKCCIAVLLSMISPVVLACGPEATMRLEAIRTLYADPDVARYVCVDDGACGIEEFSRQLDVIPVSLNPAGAAPPPGRARLTSVPKRR